MKYFLSLLILFACLPSAFAQQGVSLGNDAWPPFIIQGPELGTSEKLVCGALERAGHSCAVVVDDWSRVLAQAKEGAIDGIAAAWRTPEREGYLMFSEPYLTNRIVPLISAGKLVTVHGVEDLEGLRVALVRSYAYGEDIEQAAASFKRISVTTSAEAIDAVADGRADVALVDELVVRAHLEGASARNVALLDAVLAFRELHFAVSREHPRAAELIADFQASYELMLADGSVNEALGVDWLATDLGNDGQLDIVMRSGVSFDDLDSPEQRGTTYALGQEDYRSLSQSDMLADVNYQADGKSHSTLQSALVEVFGKDVVCEHQEYSSTFDCSKLFKKR
jgi:polar amino acid transport system substrate-binding protein